jgi:hypothetical protein
LEDGRCECPIGFTGTSWRNNLHALWAPLCFLIINTLGAQRGCTKRSITPNLHDWLNLSLFPPIFRSHLQRSSYVSMSSFTDWSPFLGTVPAKKWGRRRNNMSIIMSAFCWCLLPSAKMNENCMQNNLPNNAGSSEMEILIY